MLFPHTVLLTGTTLDVEGMTEKLNQLVDMVKRSEHSTITASTINTLQLSELRFHYGAVFMWHNEEPAVESLFKAPITSTFEWCAAHKVICTYVPII